MTREEKIEAIYAEIANKDTTIGCRVQTEWFGKMLKGTILDGTNILREDGEVEENCILRNVEIIGHPVMIGDVLDWLDKKICLLIDQGKDIEKLVKGSDALNLKLLNIRKHKTKPLDEQPNHCIDYVTNLLDHFGSVI